jgi:hypothetical protein
MKDTQKLVNEVIVGPFITHSPSKNIQPGCDYREDFNLKAGSTGTKPRPDTYTISCEVTYEFKGKTHYKNADIDISVFPSLQSMLLGTIVGSILGTLVTSLTNTSADGISNVVTKNPELIPYHVLSFLSVTAVNIILGFIIGVTLMRKKDVQPFLTVEDFWGGLLIGFFVGYLGKSFVDNFISFNPPTPVNSGGNSTSV